MVGSSNLTKTMPEWCRNGSESGLSRFGSSGFILQEGASEWGDIHYGGFRCGARASAAMIDQGFSHSGKQGDSGTGFQIDGVGSDVFAGNPVNWRSDANSDYETIASPYQNLGRFQAGFDEKIGWRYQYGDRTHSESEIFPGINLQTDASFEAQAKLDAYARGAAAARLSLDGVKAHLMAEAGASAEASIDATFNPTVEISGLIAVGNNSQGRADASSGAQAAGALDASLGLDSAYVGAGGSAFAGANASVQGSEALTVNGQQVAEAHGGVGAQAGIGVSAKGDIGLKDGEFHFDLDAGLALGIGLHIDLGGSINIKFLTDTVSNAWDAGTGLFADPLGTTADLASDAWTVGTNLASNVWDVGAGLADDTLDAGTKLVTDTVKTAVNVVDTAVNVVDTGVGAVVDTGEKVIKAVDKAMPWNW